MLISNSSHNIQLPETIINLIPIQKKGNSRDSISFCENQDIHLLYDKVKNRLLDINNWYKYTSITNLNFQIFSEDKNPIERFLLKDDLIRIEFLKDNSLPIFDIVMNDWVIVEKINEFENESYKCFILQLAPYQSNSCKEMKHFYNSEASNTFILLKENDKVTLSIHGRNEYPNFRSKSKLSIFRNIMMANLGIIGVDRFLWDKFAENLLKFE